MGFWNRLFGKADEPAPAAPPPAPPAASPLAKPPAAATLPLGQTNVGRLAEQFLRSYLILTGHAPGSRPEAQAFDDWLESYRDDPHKILAQAACHPGCAEAEVNIPGGKVFWWEIADPQTRFLCSFAGISGYAIPRNAAPVPTITDFTPPATPLARVVSVKEATPPPPPPAPPPASAPAPAKPGLKLSVIREKLADENIMVRMGAVTELEENGTPDALPGIREAMLNDHIAVRIQAGYALGRLTELIAPKWAKPLQGGPHEVQVKAVRQLDHLAVLHAAAVPELVEVVLTDQHLAAITFAVTGLCMIGQKAALGSVLSIDVLRAEGFESGLMEQVERLNAAGVAGILGLQAALGCPVVTARQDVENTLRTIAPFRDRLLQLGWLLHPKQEGAGNDPPPTDPAEVARTVADLSSPRADLRSSYALWLAMRDPVIVAPHVRRIAEMLTKDPEPEVRSAAALALGALGRFAALGVLGLRSALRDPDAGVRAKVALSLGAVGPAAGLAVPALNAAATADPSAEVREAARRAAQRLGPTFAS